MRYILMSAALPEVKNISLDSLAPLVISGIGKINATIACLNAIAKYQPDLIINYGIAGSIRKDLSGLVECSKFIDRDMDCRAIGLKRGEIPLEKKYIFDSNRDRFTCASGDSIVSKVEPWFEEMEIDLVDMEAFAIAKVCDSKGIFFYCFKYISDWITVNHDFANWKQKMKEGAKVFYSFLKNEFGRSSLI